VELLKVLLCVKRREKEVKVVTRKLLLVADSPTDKKGRIRPILSCRKQEEGDGERTLFSPHLGFAGHKEGETAKVAIVVLKGGGEKKGNRKEKKRLVMVRRRRAIRRAEKKKKGEEWRRPVIHLLRSEGRGERGDMAHRSCGLTRRGRPRHSRRHAEERRKSPPRHVAQGEKGKEGRALLAKPLFNRWEKEKGGGLDHLSLLATPAGKGGKRRAEEANAKSIRSTEEVGKGESSSLGKKVARLLCVPAKGKKEEGKGLTF